jgi:hypothetical protein
MMRWYHLSFSDGMFGYVDTQTQRTIVMQQDHRISIVPRSVLDATHPTTVKFVPLIEGGRGVVVLPDIGGTRERCHR